MDKDGKVLINKNIECNINEFIEYVAPFKRSITVGVESTYNWYWLLDELQENGINCALVIMSTIRFDTIHLKPLQ
jgi:hypothetical protein